MEELINVMTTHYAIYMDKIQDFGITTVIKLELYLENFIEISQSINLLYFIWIPALIMTHISWKLARRHTLKLASNIPGPSGLPILGNAFLFWGSSSDIFKKLHNISLKYGNITKFWIRSNLLIFITDPRDIEIVLNSNTSLEKSNQYKIFKPWLGESHQTKWKNHRKLITPTFSPNVLKSFINIFNVHSKELVQQMEKLNGKSFDCYDYLQQSSIEILLETVMGVNTDSHNNQTNDYTRTLLKMSNIMNLRYSKYWIRPNWFFKWTKVYRNSTLDTIDKFTNDTIKKKKDGYNRPKIENKEVIVVENGKASNMTYKPISNVHLNDKKRQLAFLDLMVEASQNGVVISDNEIKQQIDNIMFQAHDTTAIASCYFLSLMGIHQEIQAKVHQELDNIFGKSNRNATFADIMEMKYLERCLLETMRLYPPVPIIARKINQNLKLASGDYCIPAGATVIVGTFKLHRNIAHYHDPDKFNPDNFLPEYIAKRHYYAYVPFSAGHRSCVGQKYAMLKLKILLSTILRRYRIISDFTEQDFRLQIGMILKPEGGFKIKLVPRMKR